MKCEECNKKATYDCTTVLIDKTVPLWSCGKHLEIVRYKQWSLLFQERMEERTKSFQNHFRLSL